MKLSTLIIMLVAMPSAFFSHQAFTTRNWRSALDASVAAWLTIGLTLGAEGLH